MSSRCEYCRSYHWKQLLSCVALCYTSAWLRTHRWRWRRCTRYTIAVHWYKALVHAAGLLHGLLPCMRRRHRIDHVLCSGMFSGTRTNSINGVNSYELAGRHVLILWQAAVVGLKTPPTQTISLCNIASTEDCDLSPNCTHPLAQFHWTTLL